MIFIVGTIAAGEALALTVGMRLPVGVINPWLSVKNQILILLDISLGVGIIAAAFCNADSLFSKWLPLFAGLALIPHTYREWEYIAGSVNAFCANRPLFIVNNFKLIGLIVIVSMAVAYWGEKPYMTSIVSGGDLEKSSMRYTVTASNVGYTRLMEKDIVSSLKKYNIGIIVAVQENQLGSELDQLLIVYEQNGISVSLSPLLSEKQGLYLNKNTAKQYLNLVKNVLQWTDAHHHRISEIVADIEPSDTGGTGAYFNFGRFLTEMDRDSFYGSVSEFQAIVSEIKSHGCSAVCCVAWFTIEDKALDSIAWQDFFGGPSILTGWDSTMIMMYSEWFLESGRIIGADQNTANSLIYRYCRDMKVLWGKNAAVILGSITGDDDSQYLSGNDMATTVAAAKAAGVNSICLYDLKGMLNSGGLNEWLKVLTATNSAVPGNRNLQTRLYKDAFRLVSNLLNIKEMLS